jgi:DNA repair exonuclease SbcCD ATPase subunit
MKLKLKNFRCYLDSIFDFGDEGILLLSGSSGKGKSTLLMAINFALYGSGTKIITFGKTSCRVELEYNNFIITRTKKPNRLTVYDSTTEQTYEDDTAQGIINEYFGNAFDITAYVQQNAVNSFLLMNPTEKLYFLEKFVFQGINIQEIKDRCQSEIKQRNEELISITSQLELRTEDFKMLKKPTKVGFPFKTLKKDLAIKNEYTRHKNTKILIKKEENKLENLKTELQDINIYNIKTKNKEELLQSINERIQKINYDEVKYKGDEYLKKYEDILRCMLSYREVIILKDKLNEDEERLDLMIQSEKENMTKEIEELDSKLWKEYTIQEVNDNIEEYEKLLKESEMLTKLKSTLKIINSKNVDENSLEKDVLQLKSCKDELTKYKELLTVLNLQKELYKCPSCHTCLKFENNKLKLSSQKIVEENTEIDFVKTKINELVKTINIKETRVKDNNEKLQKYKEINQQIQDIENKYNEEIPSLDEIKNTIEYLNQYKNSQKQIENRKTLLKQNLKNNTYSNSVSVFKNQLSKKKEQIKEMEKHLDKNLEQDSTEEEIRNIVYTEKQNKNKALKIIQETKELNRELNIHLEEKDKLKHKHEEKYHRICDISQINVDIEDCKKNVETLKQTLEKHEQNIQKIEEYKKYKEEYDKYIDCKKRLEELQEQECKKRQKYAASTLLKEKILQAESITISNIVNSINIHAQEFLDVFFPTDPITVRLSAFKETKKSCKPQINLEIDYKGMEADISMLSGGELSRVVLAFTLALSEIFNAPVILLDECTASIDQELTSVVIEGIKNVFPNKLIVVIAHQVVSGNFDREIKI